MVGTSESCSVCGHRFEVQFRYQTEESEGGVSFFCSQPCLQRSAQKGAGDGLVACDGCGQRFQVELVSHVVFLRGQRRYACSLPCRSHLATEAAGASSENALVPGVAGFPGAHAGSGPRVVAVFNHKGGTGKTTTSVSLAAGLAERGKRVLLVDSDSQGNVGASLNVKAQRTLYHVVVMGLSLEQAVVPVRPNLDLLASNETLAAAELYLAGRQNRDRVLSQRLARAKDLYDVVVVDCSPSLSLMNQNALVFADHLLVPVACDFLSLVGVRQVIRTLKHVNELLHHPVRLWGVLPTFYDARARICREAIETLVQHFGARCLPPIRAAMKVKEAPAQGRTIFEYAGGSSVACDYLTVVDRMLADVEGVEWAGQEASVTVREERA